MSDAVSDFDECECGDYRKDHSHHGSCVFNAPQNTGHLGAPNCYGFRLFRAAMSVPAPYQPESSAPSSAD